MRKKMPQVYDEYGAWNRWLKDQEIAARRGRGRPYDGAIINEDGELVIPHESTPHQGGEGK